VVEAAQVHQDFLAREVLAGSVRFGPAGGTGFTGEAGDGIPVRVSVTRG
jgi:isoleucyl-tRNA synthetase